MAAVTQTVCLQKVKVVQVHREGSGGLGSRNPYLAGQRLVTKPATLTLSKGNPAGYSGRVECNADSSDPSAAPQTKVSSRDAARLALEQALNGSKDILKDNDPKEDTGGGDGNDNGGNNDDGDGWRRWWGDGGEEGNGKKSSWEDLSTSLAAFGYLMGAVLLFSCWKPMLALVVNLGFFIFRVDPNKGVVQTVDTTTSAEQNMMAQWGDDDDE